MLSLHFLNTELDFNSIKLTACILSDELLLSCYEYNGHILCVESDNFDALGILNL